MKITVRYADEKLDRDRLKSVMNEIYREKEKKENEKMPVSEAKVKANAKYDAKAYDKFLVRVPKGKKAAITAHAKLKGESLNGFVNKAIDEKIEREA